MWIVKQLTPTGNALSVGLAAVVLLLSTGCSGPVPGTFPFTTPGGPASVVLPGGIISTSDAQGAAKAQALLFTVCSTAMMLAPVAGPYAPFIVAGCGSEEAIARLALDPTSINWLNGIIAKVRTLAPTGTALVGRA